MNKINTDLKYLFTIYVVLFLAIILTYAHHGHLLLDCGREAYYPTQILLGKILYKDILNIYGPFSYMLNALLFKIFSVNLNVLYLSGCFCAFLIISFIYLISKQFLSRFLSFAIAIFTISIGVLNLNLFNFIFPYSYGMLYGIVSFLLSFWLLLKYQIQPEKNLYLYLSCFFTGVCITNKYEFLPYLIVILYSLLKINSLKMKEYYYALFSLLFIPIFCFGILFLQGLSTNDLISSVSIIKKITQSQTLKYFYLTQGLYFHKNTFIVLISNFIRTIIPLGFILYGFKASKKIFSIILNTSAIILMFCWINPASFAFLPILIIILAIINLKNLTKHLPLMLLTLSSITISLKSFWGLATLNYGVFFVSFLLITVFALFFDIFKDRDINPKAFGTYILIVAMILGFQNILTIKWKSYLLKTNKGEIYTNKEFYEASKDLIKYIETNTKKTDEIVIFPEGAFINFLTNRASDNFYISMLPLYVESMGEENIINHFKKTKPKYIIFNNWNTKDYYFNYICDDYAIGFCSFVAENYKQEKVIDKGFRYLIFKKR